MKVFLDTNVIVDFLAEREGFFHPAAVIIDLAKNGEYDIVVSATTFINSFYLLKKHYPTEDIYEKLERLAAYSNISPIDSLTIKEGLKMKAKDFEDSVQWLSSNSIPADVIVTRDKHFKEYKGEIKTPEQFLDDYFANKTT